jgi:hypothetical protein
VWVSILLISSFAPVAAADQNMAVSTSAIISDRLEIVSFLCGSLSAREKAQLTDEIEREISKDPRRWQHDYARIHADVMTLHKNDPELSTEVFENWRRTVALNDQPDDPERHIVDAHDPIVILDKAHQRIVTLESLQSLREALAWTAKQSGGPRPDAEFIARERYIVEHQYWGWPDKVQDAYAHIVENFPSAADYINFGMTAQERATLWSIWKKKPRSTADVAVDLMQFYRHLLIQKMALVYFKRNMAVMSTLRMQQHEAHEKCELDRRAAREVSLCP